MQVRSTNIKDQFDIMFKLTFHQQKNYDSYSICIKLFIITDLNI